MLCRYRHTQHEHTPGSKGLICRAEAEARSRFHEAVASALPSLNGSTALWTPRRLAWAPCSRQDPLSNPRRTWAC